MDLVALELVDAGLQFVSSRGRLSRPSPGLALIDGDELAVGLEAEHSARLKPRRLHSRFWQELGTAPLGRPFPAHLRTADLAHAHLKAVWESDGGGADEVLVAVPGVYDDGQLALLLGITRSIGIPVRGLIDAAVAAAADREVAPRCLHLDLHLHQTVLTELEHAEAIARIAVRMEPRIGLMALRDAWARTIAHAFVRATRFDPLHLAATEQVLYSQLGDHLSALEQGGSTQVRVASGGRQHVVELDRDLIVGAAASAYDLVAALVPDSAEPDGTTLLLSHRAAALPGLANHLEAATGLSVAVLHPAAAGSGALAHADRLRARGDALPFVTRLPGLDARPPGPVTVAVTPPREDGRRLPTHLVIEGVARPIGPEPLIVATGGDEAPLPPGRPTASVRRIAGQAVLDAPPGSGVVLNGESIEGRTALAPGDRLRVDTSDAEIVVVTMAD